MASRGTAGTTASRPPPRPRRRTPRPGPVRPRAPASARGVGGDVGHDAGLVVGGAAAVEPAVALDGGSKGAVSHSARSPVGCTSWWAYSRIVGLPSAAGRRATTAGPPGVPSSLSQRRIRTSSKPLARTRPATASALRFSGAGSKLGQAMPGMATRSVSWPIVSIERFGNGLAEGFGIDGAGRGPWWSAGSPRLMKSWPKHYPCAGSR